MTTTLGIDDALLEARDGAWTAREIAQQPRVWGEVIAGAADAGLAAFVARQLATPQLRILLTGAGTSAFIGESLAPAIARHTRARVDAVPTTDLVAGPARYFQREAPTLMVHFARSGNSPESTAAVDLADAVLTDCRHLVITCNPDGALAAAARVRPAARLVVLPDRTNDRSFAMTSSFTTMLLVAARVFGVVGEAPVAAGVDAVRRGDGVAHALVAQGFDRIVYLGSNTLQGLAREAALKMLELTDGEVIALHESPLGFRHGPKTIVNERTLVVMFLSNDPAVRAYDLDLLRELRKDGRARRVYAIAGQAGDAQDGIDFVVDHLAGASELQTVAPFAAVAQLLALHRSASLGLTPDQPSRSGTVNRVVRGVVIHPLASEA